MHLGFGVLMGWLLSQNLFEERSIFKRRLMLILALVFTSYFSWFIIIIMVQADIFPIH